jgi:DNA-binding HxlR family transcriptional regulator
MDTGTYQTLDEILHSRIRLAIVSVLVTVEKIDFPALRNRVGATDGNMNTHLKKLEEAGYINVEKLFVNRKPLTNYRLTTKGLKRFHAYVRALDGFVHRKSDSNEENRS